MISLDAQVKDSVDALRDRTRSLAFRYTRAIWFDAVFDELHDTLLLTLRRVVEEKLDD